MSLHAEQKREPGIPNSARDGLSSGTLQGSATEGENVYAPVFGADLGSQRAAISSLQERVGNDAVQRLLAEKSGLPTQTAARAKCRCQVDCQCGKGNIRQIPRAPSYPVAQRQELREGLADEAARVASAVVHRSLLGKIQGHAMFALLPRLEQLPPEVRRDEVAGGFVGGPRLVTAMRVVTAKLAGTQWLPFVAAHNGELAALPGGQIDDIITYLGAPRESRYFKADQLGGRFDGAVDASGNVITLFFRVKFELGNVGRVEGVPPGAKGWDEKVKEAKARFARDFPAAVKGVWSGKGTVKPSCSRALGPFQTKVEVSVVESGEHRTIYLHTPIAEGRSNMGEIGNLTFEDNQARTRTKQVVDPTGRKPVHVTTTSVTSAHEFGHAIGLDHPRCKSGDDNCYGVTAEEYRDVMGGGDQLQVIVRGGKVVHNDFLPFEKIGERWGKEVFPGALGGKCNKWSSGG